MKRFIIGSLLVIASFCSYANDPAVTGIYDLRCFSTENKMYTVQADANSGDLTLDGKLFKGISTTQQGTTVSLGYKNTDKFFFLFINTETGESTFLYGNDKVVETQGKCYLDNSVLI